MKSKCLLLLLQTGQQDAAIDHTVPRPSRGGRAVRLGLSRVQSGWGDGWMDGWVVVTIKKLWLLGLLRFVMLLVGPPTQRIMFPGIYLPGILDVTAHAL